MRVTRLARPSFFGLRCALLVVLAGGCAADIADQASEHSTRIQQAQTYGQFITVGTTGYYVDLWSFHYCKIDSWAQWVAAGGPRSNFNYWGSIPLGYINDGECTLPAGYFFNNGTGYYANSAGHYCAFTSWPQWLAAGGPRSGAPTFVPIPSSMVYDGICGG